MGLLVDGQWQDKWYDTTKSGGAFVRERASFRNWITADGTPGPTGDGGFKAEAGRYHLYVAMACPWANRALIFRALKGLADLISVSVVHPDMLGDGWTFDRLGPSRGDDLYNSDFLHEIYTRADPNFTGRVTVPVLWDKRNQTIVNNESADIIRIFNSAFNELTGDTTDYYPESLRSEIDELNAVIYETVNNGVYRAGFATTQSAYEEAFHSLFKTLDELDQRLEKSRYLTGEQITEADWRLFTTLVRFDDVYVGHFKCNKQRIADYNNLSGYLRELYQFPGIAETVDFEQTKRHYYYSHKTINPSGVIPVGPDSNLLLDHGRSHLRSS
ncbi:glutathione S-transferase family protein [Sessilibacter corallicola]|uniref:glutathione S-transferase family protein n=1 Tax=Sessilibacter corallicola TaxID=2904075 RepID=UPI001E39C727|nr:glutathione S-transferase family protein [Sessilibacter corallicola]MCE2027799.1 glutathione S-transferase family protein [Sessilibacter corallicola]